MRGKLTRESFSPTIESRLWSKVVRRGEEECWPFVGARLPFGYGRIGVSTEAGVDYAHRVAYVLDHDVDIPDGMVVMHTCDNPPCCNPRHLVLGTQLDNIRDRSNKGRSRGGSGAPRGRLPANKGKFILADRLDEIAELYESGMTAKEIAGEIGASLSSSEKAVRLCGVEARRPGRRKRL